MNQQSKLWPFLMCAVPVLFFSFQFILRLWPSLMMQPIMTQFSIAASDYGVLASAYYFGYAGMQIPVALLCERYGVRWILFGSAVLCGLATFLLTYTHDWHAALLARFCVGAGSAVGFLGLSKSISEWFSPDQYTRMIGFSFTIGLLGAIYGGRPVGLLVEHYNGEQVANALAWIAIGFGILSLLFVRSPRQIDPLRASGFGLSDLKALLSSPAIWVLGVANLLMVGTLEGFADVWGVQYLMQAYGLLKSDAAGLVSLIFVGMLFGGPAIAFLSKKWGNYPILTGCGLVTLLGFMALLMLSRYQGFYLSVIFFILGLTCCYQVLIFSVASQSVAPALQGVAIAFLNCINMLGGSFFHTLIGRTMDYYWTGLVNAEGVRQYSLWGLKMALMIIPLSALLGSVLLAGLGYRLYQSKRSNLKFKANQLF